VRQRWLAALLLLAALGRAWEGHGRSDSRIADDARPDFVEVPAGPFIMGADPARDPMAFDNERWSAALAQGTVDLPAFLIGRSEVTVSQFAAFAAARTSTVSPESLSGSPAHPVRFVTWPEALAYCRWLQAAMSGSPQTPPRVSQLLRDGWKVSLPNEAQWEKAARGADGRRFPWGAEPRRDRANFNTTGPVPVGQFRCPECPYGLADMSGNVWEWTASPNQPYPYDPNDDRASLDADALWVIRGGHFGDDARLVRTTARGAAEPGARRAFIGFRVALVPPAR